MLLQRASHHKTTSHRLEPCRHQAPHFSLLGRMACPFICTHKAPPLARHPYWAPTTQRHSSRPTRSLRDLLVSPLRPPAPTCPQTRLRAQRQHRRRNHHQLAHGVGVRKPRRNLTRPRTSLRRIGLAGVHVAIVGPCSLRYFADDLVCRCLCLAIVWRVLTTVLMGRTAIRPDASHTTQRRWPAAAQRK